MAQSSWLQGGMGSGIMASLSSKLYNGSLVARTQASHTISIHAGKNNTILHLGSPEQATILVASGGSAGLKKGARGTSDAGFQAAQVLVDRVRERGIRMEGFGPGREQAIRAIRGAASSVINLTRITDVTPIRFGGCRPPKKRRV